LHKKILVRDLLQPIQQSLPDESDKVKNEEFGTGKDELSAAVACIGKCLHGQLSIALLRLIVEYKIC